MARFKFLSRLRLAGALATFCVCAASAQTPAMPTPTPVPADSIPALPAATPQTTPQTPPTAPQQQTPQTPPDPLLQPTGPPPPPTTTTPPVYHDPLEAPMNVPRQPTPVAIPQQTVANIPSEPAYDLHALVAEDHPYDFLGSTYIPVDSPIYPLALRLYSLGYLDTAFISMRPWTRRSLLHALTQTATDATNDGNEQAQQIVAHLLEELAAETPGKGLTRGSVYGVESVYTRLMGITARPTPRQLPPRRDARQRLRPPLRARLQQHHRLLLRQRKGPLLALRPWRVPARPGRRQLLPRPRQPALLHRHHLRLHRV